MEPTPDSTTGMPLLPAQTAIACARVVNAMGDLMGEYLVLPNLVCVLSRDPLSGIMVGECNVASTPWTQHFITGLGRRAASMDADPEDDRTMTLLDLATETL